MPYIVNRNEGWNSGARSRKICAGDCQLEFSPPPSNAGLCIGFNTSDASFGFREIKHALYFQKVAGFSNAFVYESGEQKAILGLIQDGDRFTIRRNGTLVRYYKNNALVYTSAVPSVGPIFVDTSLFAGGDRV